MYFLAFVKFELCSNPLRCASSERWLIRVRPAAFLGHLSEITKQSLWLRLFLHYADGATCFKLRRLCVGLAGEDPEHTVAEDAPFQGDCERVRTKGVNRERPQNFGPQGQAQGVACAQGVWSTPCTIFCVDQNYGDNYLFEERDARRDRA